MSGGPLGPPPDRRHVDDPAQTGGTSAGVGGPHDRNAVVYDTRNAVIVEGFESSVAHTTHHGEPGPDSVALVVRGRRNRPPDHAPSAEAPRESVEHLHLMSWDAAADLVVDVQALASRDGTLDDFKQLLERKWAERKAEDAT